MSLTNTPAANRLHIGIFGKRNAGKSSLINAITGQNIALVSDAAGTTTDPVFKAMEIAPLGPCMFIDTAGFDDVGELGELRIKRTKDIISRIDIAIIVFSDMDFTHEAKWIKALKRASIPILAVINKSDICDRLEDISREISANFELSPLLVSAKTGSGVEKIKDLLARLIPTDFEAPSITGHLATPGDTVLLVMPQDIQAPKGRLILPQVQTIRDLLDNRAVIISTTTDMLDNALKALSAPPKLIITDSQVFKEVCAKKPAESLLTSFSVLFARHKGNIDAFIEGAQMIDSLKETDTVLIAEACTHATMDGDIARVKIPNLLKKKVGDGIKIELVSGFSFPDNLSKYALIIHCGGCMFNRKYLLSRITKAQTQGIPITNYGVAISKLTGILEHISF